MAASQGSQRRHDQQRKLHAALNHKHPCLVFAIGLAMGVLLDRQITAGLIDLNVGSASSSRHDCDCQALHEVLESRQAHTEHTPVDRVALERTIPRQECPICAPCRNESTCMPPPPDDRHGTTRTMRQPTTTKQLQQTMLFPEDSIQDLVAGMGRVNRDEFAKQFDLGYALDPTTPATRHVLVLYGSDKSLPTSHYTLQSLQQQHAHNYELNTYAATSNASSYLMSPVLSVDDAFANCHTVKVVLIQPTKKIYRRKKKIRHDAECLAVMSQWESQHVHQFQRQRPQQRTGNDGNVTTGSSTTSAGAANTTTAVAWKYTAARADMEEVLPEHVQASNLALITYLRAIPKALERLDPILRQAVGRNDDSDGSRNNHTTTTANSHGPVIVMVCNYGQANLLTNFVCAARARGLDLGRIVVFATDTATQQLAASLGLLVFSDDVIFGGIPQEAAHDYSDARFGLVMMAKIYCVHLTLLRGYDVLFQDADIVWYEDPLLFFQNITSYPPTDAFDMYFQHDGYHHPERFRPVAANTGLYYVRHNSRTLHLFNMFARLGDQVLASKSHQATLTVLVNEHMSTYGLRVKVLGNEAERFPNGFAFQKGAKITRYMREDNTTKPILFHANWLAKNKKRPAFEGTLNWFLHTQCYDNATDELRPDLPTDVFQSCCLLTPCCNSAPVSTR